jgi:RNA polymerase sigma-70 factor, ECF subfamily
MHHASEFRTLLVAWTDLGYEEVARAPGVQPGTVRSRLDRAHRKVREALRTDPAFGPST